MKRIVLAFALISTPVCAEDLPSGLEDLSIEGVGYQGRKALEQFYGRPLTVSEGRWKGVFHLSPGGQVDWEKPSGGTLHGHFGDGPQHPAMCLDFSYDDSACFDVQQVKSALKFESEGGKSFGSQIRCHFDHLLHETNASRGCRVQTGGRLHPKRRLVNRRCGWECA